MKKMKYTKPELEVIAFDNEDVIVASELGVVLPDDYLKQKLLQLDTWAVPTCRNWLKLQAASRLSRRK